VSRNSRADVVAAAGRLFARNGYHGTSMRELGRELGLRGSSLYSHITSKEALLLDVVERAAQLFDASAAAALATEGNAERRLRILVAGHVDVVVDHLDEARTFLNEARSLDDASRRRVLDHRDRYERSFRRVLAEGVDEGRFRSDLDPALAGIMLLSILNAIDRWYRPDGPLDRDALVTSIISFVIDGLGGRPVAAN